MGDLKKRCLTVTDEGKVRHMAEKIVFCVYLPDAEGVPRRCCFGHWRREVPPVSGMQQLVRETEPEVVWEEGSEARAVDSEGWVAWAVEKVVHYDGIP